MDVTEAHNKLVCLYERLRGKNLLFNPTVVNPRAPAGLHEGTRRPGVIFEAVKRERNKYQGVFRVTYTPTFAGRVDGRNSGLGYLRPDQQLWRSGASEEGPASAYLRRRRARFCCSGRSLSTTGTIYIYPSARGGVYGDYPTAREA